MDIVAQVEQGFLSKDPRERRRVLGLVAQKKAGGIELKVRDQRVIPVLARALSDKDVGVRRSAAMALRPFVQEEPALMASILPEYAINSFNGKYTHVGLLDVRTGRIWIPPFQAKGGHAALMSDGTTDHYFKFDFHVPGQVPPMYKRTSPGESTGHLTLHFITDWSYSKQSLLADFEERWRQANLREQERFGRQIIAFYRECRLSYRVYVHQLLTQEGQKPIYEFQVEEIEAAKKVDRFHGL